jgi:cell division transport system permease protein
MTFASIVVVTLTLTLLGIALMVRTGTRKTESGYLNQINVSVYLQPVCGAPQAPASCLTPADQAQIQSTLQNMPQVQSVQFITSAQALVIFRRLYPHSPALTNLAGSGTLPESFVVKLRDPREFAVVKSAVGAAPGVESVMDASAVLNKLFRIFDHISFLVLAFAAALFIATVLLIYNAMRLAAFTRRKETGIMRLVGASNAMIQAPFILEGVVIGLIGGMAATVTLILVRIAVHQILDIRILYQLGTWSTLLSALPWVWLVAIVLPGLAAYATLQRHLRV